MRTAIASALVLLAACSRSPAPPADAPAPAPAPVAMPAPAEAPPPSAPPATAAPPGQVLLALRCRGEAPAWRLTIRSTGRDRLRTEDEDIDLVGELKPGAGGYAWQAAPEDAPGESFAALLTPVACFPPSGGNALPWTVQLGWPDGDQGDGCCSAQFGLDVAAAAPFDAAAAADWTRDLARLGPLVAHCAFDAGVDTRAVTAVQPAAAGKIVVRLRDSDGARFDCLVDPENRDIEAVAAVAAGDRLDGEGGSEWLPADEDALPRLDCGEVFRDEDAEGLRGWIHVRRGC